MTARELIDILNTCDENANVLIEQFVLQWAINGLKKK